MFRRLLFISILILIILIGGFFFIYQTKKFSKDVLRVEILAPEKVKMGEEIEYTLRYKNNGNFLLENTRLVFEFPPYSKTENNKSRVIQDLEDIYPGEEKVIKFKARLIGKEGDSRTAKAIITFTPKNLTTKYEVETTFTSLIETVPFTLNFILPSKAERGKSFPYSLSYFSNVDCDLENLAIKIFSPPGFEIESAEPLSVDGIEWSLRKISKTEGGRINIRGRILTELEEKLTFRAQLGIWESGEFILIKETEKDLQVIQPLIFISQQVNGLSSYIASPGEVLHYEIFFKNIGESPFENLFIIAKISGPAIDFSTLQVKNGYIQEKEKLVIWDYKNIPELKQLAAQAEGKVEFFVKVRENLEAFEMGEEANVITTEVNISQIVQRFTVKVNSGLVVSQTVYYKSDEFENSGPIPPRVGETTTYTVRWEIKNYFNNVENVKVRAILPAGVSLTGNILPADEFRNFSFDSTSREILWMIGSLPAGTGVRGDPYFLSFQIALTPLPEQKGFFAPLIGKVRVSGENQFTNTIITFEDDEVTTALPDDFSHSGGGIVQ